MDGVLDAYRMAEDCVVNRRDLLKGLGVLVAGVSNVDTLFAKEEKQSIDFDASPHPVDAPTINTDFPSSGNVGDLFFHRTKQNDGEYLYKGLYVCIKGGTPSVWGKVGDPAGYA